MIQIIQNKRYDTDTATELASWSNGRGGNDFHYVVEKLYRTSRGAFFSHGRGGAASQYREQAGGNMWSGGERIMPLTDEQAYQWCESHGLTDAIENLFPDRVEDA